MKLTTIRDIRLAARLLPLLAAMAALTVVLVAHTSAGVEPTQMSGSCDASDPVVLTDCARQDSGQFRWDTNTDYNAAGLALGTSSDTATLGLNAKSARDILEKTIAVSMEAFSIAGGLGYDAWQARIEWDSGLTLKSLHFTGAGPGPIQTSFEGPGNIVLVGASVLPGGSASVDLGNLALLTFTCDTNDMTLDVFFSGTGALVITGADKNIVGDDLTVEPSVVHVCVGEGEEEGTPTIAATSTPAATSTASPSATATAMLTETPVESGVPTVTTTPTARAVKMVTATPTASPTLLETPSEPESTPTPTSRSPVLGDASCDGTVDAFDARLIFEVYVGFLASLPCNNADVNSDGVTGAVDAALILQFAAGLLHGLPP